MPFYLAESEATSEHAKLTDSILEVMYKLYPNRKKSDDEKEAQVAEWYAL